MGRFAHDKRWSALPAAAFLAALLIAFPARSDQDSPALDLEGMTFVSSRGEVNELVLRSKRARFEPKSSIAYLEDVDASVADSGDREAFEMTCDRGRLNLETNDFHAEGNVVGVTEGGRHFEAPWVKYVHEEGLLYTEAPVVLTESTGTYRGGGFQYFVRERRFRLLGGTTVVQDDQ